jgi:Domain of unknown function (DUF4345)
VRAVALVFFFGYTATLVVAGLWGALLAQFDFPLILDLELDEIPDDAEATLLSHYRFLRAVEFCFGMFALAYWRQIFAQRIPNVIFLTTMAAGGAARLVGLAFDGSPSALVYVVLAWELVGAVVIFLATRSARAG